MKPENKKKRDNAWKLILGAAAMMSLAIATPAALGSPEDSDDDGVANAEDNCTQVANPGQQDADGDHFGNPCDGDLDNDGVVTDADFDLLRSVLNQPATASALAAASDINGSGSVTVADFQMLRAQLNASPGPSGLVP